MPDEQAREDEQAEQADTPSDAEVHEAADEILGEQQDVVEDSPESDAAEGAPAEFENFSDGSQEGEGSGIELLMDVDLEVKIELGRADMAIDDILKLRKGSVVELDKLAGDPVDVLVNGRLVARGEILVVNDNFCVRVTDIVDPEAGLKAGDAQSA